MYVLDGKRHFLTDFETHVAQQRFRASQRYGARIPAPSELAASEPLPARVHENRWIVDCPDCRSAAIVWFVEATPDNAHPFLCDNCLNNVVANRWRPVSAPSSGDRRMIEAVLQARPIPLTRNWYPHETLEELMAENTDHGVPIAKGASGRLPIPDVEG